MDKTDFKTKAIKRDPEGHFIILKGRIHQGINIIHIGAPKYVWKILKDFNKDVDRNTLILGDFNTPLSTKDKSSKQNTNKDIVALNNAPDKMDSTDIYIKPFIPRKQNTLFSSAHGIFSKLHHIIRHKTSLNKFKKIEIISSIFSDHKGLKLETNFKEKISKILKLVEIEYHAIKQ